jgi:hypothetical protein
MTAGRASARHLIECLRNCLQGDAADALLRAAEAHARRLEERCRRDGEGWLLPPDWLGGLPPDDGWAPESPAGRAERRRALLLALDHAADADALALPEADADEEPEAASTRLAAAEFGLDGLDEAVLLLALRCAAETHLHGFADAVLDRLRDPAAAVAALLGAGPREARRRLAPGAPLFASGLLAPTTVRYSLFGHGYDEGALLLASSLPRATERALEGREPWIEALLGRPAPPELDWSDFAHLAEPAEVAVRLLRGAALSGAKGVNILLHGPVGTGKTRLAATIAARAGLALHAVGEADEEGDEPSRTERASALRLALALTASRRDAALLFDEGEDLLEAAPRQSEAREGRSKAWLNRVLEDNPTPVLWTINDLHRVDRATLRRMSLLVEVGVPEEEAVRERIWSRVLGLEGLALGGGAAVRLAGRWAAAPALCASAARAARLSGGGAAEVEAAMRGYAQVLGGGAPRAGHGGDPASAAPDLELLACDADIEALAARLAAPGAPQGWALLVAGPAGSGRSTLAAHLAAGAGLPVVRRRGADLAGVPSGEASRALAAAFAEARAKQAVLVLDGIDAVAAERGAPGADDAALDALLAEMDGHPLPLVCVADVPPRLDRAALRRFTLTVRLGALDPERAALAFRRVLGAEPPGPLPEGLTVGDFAAVRLRRDLLGGDAGAATLRAWLAERAEAGGAALREVGFRVVSARGGSREDRARGAEMG